MPLVRSGRCRRDGAPTGGGRLTSELSDVSDEFLRSGLELAFAVALAGARLQPPVAAPASLRPFLRFKRLPPAALGPVRRAVEADDEFRSRVALVANDELVDRAASLWIQRPEGWEHDLLELWDAQRAGEEAEAEERAERTAQKRLDAAERAARRAQAEVAVLRGELDAERSGRHAADAARSAADRRARQLDVELSGARRRLGASDEEKAALRVKVAELEAALAHTRDGVDVGASIEPTPVDPEPAVVVPPPAGPRDALGDRLALAAALEDAVEATRRLASALDAARRSLVDVEADADVDAITPPSMLAAGGVAPDSPPSIPESFRRIDIDSTKRRGEARRRRAVPLPVGMLSDSAEAAVHLLHVPGVIVLVDGYNVAKLAWPAEPLPEQRRRLIDLMVELTARHPATVKVIFDGSDVGAPRHNLGRHVRVAFSPLGVTADEVLVDLVEEFAGERAVAVVTSDRALGEAVRALGANVIRSDQLLATAHRLPGDPPEVDR